jgi:hypothetical protein
VVFLDPRANAELVPKFHVALHASHAAILMVTSKFRPNIALAILVQTLLVWLDVSQPSASKDVNMEVEGSTAIVTYSYELSV